MKGPVGSGIDDAIRAAGGLERLGEALGCSHTSVCRWRQKGRVPADRVLALEAVTGVPRHRLRPDLYPPPHTGIGAGLAETQTPLEAQISEAEALGLDPAAISVAALRQAIGDEKARRWAVENREAIEEHNAWVEKHGLILAKYRMF